MDFVGTIFTTLGNIVLAIFKIALFLVLSVLVVPSMIIMSFLHKPWEELLGNVFTLDHF